MTDESPRLSGILSVLCTPFDEHGGIDEESLISLIDHQLRWEVDGLVIFGLAGELYKLTDDDRRRVLTAVAARVGGAVPLIVGTEHSGTEGAIERSRIAERSGASALMLYPPTFVKPDAAGIVDYFVAVGESVSLPIIIQDAPQWTGIPLPVDLLLTIAAAAPNVSWVKVEAPPAAQKIRDLRAHGLGVIGGFGALHLIEDLQAGVQAVMPGCALPGLYHDLWSAHRRGLYEQLWVDFTRALPLLSYQMSSLDTFVAVQKYLLYKSGVLRSPTMRRPVGQLGPDFSRWVEELVVRADVGRYLEPRGGGVHERARPPGGKTGRLECQGEKYTR